MTLAQYQLKIISILDKFEEGEYDDDCDAHLIALNELSETIHNALKEYNDESLNKLNKHVTLSIMIMELAIDSGIITLKTT